MGRQRGLASELHRVYGGNQGFTRSEILDLEYRGLQSTSPKPKDEKEVN